MRLDLEGAPESFQRMRARAAFDWWAIGLRDVRIGDVLAGKLSDCWEPMSDRVCEALGLPEGSTYAQGVQVLARPPFGRFGLPPLSEIMTQHRAKEERG